MRTDRLKPFTRLWAVLAALALVLAACGNDDDNGDDPVDPGDTTDDAAPGDAACDEVSIGWIPWDEDIAVTYLWAALLDEQGVETDLTQLDVGPVFAGVAAGDLDLFLDAWLPNTHEDYWEEYGDDMESLAIWYDEGTLEITVPAYLEDINSIADLADNADMFDSQIIGIEPGAGLTRITREEAMPTYGLDDWELLDASTTAMLAELDRAYGAEEPIVVTLWHPHWAYGAFDLKDLEDPEGVMGEAEELHAVARADFSSDCPEVAGWISNFELDTDSLAELTNMVINEYDTEEEGVEAWLSDDDNRALADSWID